MMHAASMLLLDCFYAWRIHCPILLSYALHCWNRASSWQNRPLFADAQLVCSRHFYWIGSSSLSSMYYAWMTQKHRQQALHHVSFVGLTVDVDGVWDLCICDHRSKELNSYIKAWSLFNAFTTMPCSLFSCHLELCLRTRLYYVGSILYLLLTHKEIIILKYIKVCAGY